MLTQKAKTAVKDDLKYHRESIKEIKLCNPILEKFAQILEPMISDEKSSYVTSNSITINLKTKEKARQLVTTLLQETTITKFEKEASSGFDGLDWHHTAKEGKVKISIGPAQPDRKCQPVKREHLSSWWVCEKRR